MDQFSDHEQAQFVPNEHQGAQTIGGSNQGNLAARSIEEGITGSLLRNLNETYRQLEGELQVLDEEMTASFKELKGLHLKLYASENNLREMALHVPGVLYQFILQPDGQIAIPYVSPGSVELLEAAPETIIQNPLAIITLLGIEPNYFFETLRTSAQTMTTWSWEGKVKLFSGTTKWIKIQSRPKRLPNEVFLWHGIAQDITERKEAEEKLQLFRFLVDQSNDGLFVIDPASGIIRDVSQKALSTLDYSRPEMLSMHFSQIDAALSNRDAWLKLIQELQENQSLTYESEHRRKNGEFFPVEISFKYIQTDDHQFIIVNARNISDRKNTEKILQAQKQYLSQILNACPHLIFIKAESGEYTLVNDAFASIHGLKSEQIIGKKDAEFHPYYQEVDYFEELDRQVVNTRQTSDPFETCIPNPLTGKPSWFQTIKVPLIVENSSVQVLSIATNITAQKLATEEIQKQKEFYESFLHNMPIDLAMFDWEHRYLFVNAKGVKNEEIRKWLIGKDDFEYCQFRNKDLSIAQNRRQAFLQALLTKQTVDLEETFQDASGNKTHYLKRFSPWFDENMEVKMMFGYGLDLTRRKQAEEKVKQSEQLLQSINSNIQVGIFRCDSKHQIIYSNQAFSDIFGINTATNELSLNFSSQFTDERQHQELIKELLDKKQIHNKEVLFLRQDGTSFWAAVNITLLQNEASGYAYDGVIRDITELKKSAELLIQKNAELEKTNSELDKFVYSASHELRAPLTSVLGLITIAKLDEPGEAQLQYLTMMEQSINRLDKFINEIVHYSRNSRLDLKPEPVDIKAMLTEILEDLYYMEGVSQIKILPEITGTSTLFTDRSRLRVVLNNLISNAIKYHTLAQEHPYVHIKINITAEKALFMVEDNGRGIDAIHVEKVFDMFFRAASDSKGSGLGLYIVKEIVTKLGGTITVRSELKKGSTFTVEIPNLSEG